MNILFREFKANRRALLTWGILLALLNLLMLAIYPSFAADAQQLEQFLALYPEGFLKVFGLDKVSMGTPVGFYATEAYFMIVLFGSMFAVILSSAMLAKEEDEKTIEFLLAKPVTRSQIVTNKLLALLGYLVLFNVGIGLVTWIGFEAFASDYSLMELLRLLIAPFFVHVTFAGLGLLLSMFVTRKKSTYSAGIGLVMALYFVNVIATLADKARSLRYLSPFFYMDAAEIIVSGGIPLSYILILSATSGVAILLTYLLYNRRDITI